MKKSNLFLPVLLCLSGCSNYLPYTTVNENDKTVLIRVECRNSIQLEDAVTQTLRLVHINDLEKQRDKETILIKARYQELPDFEASEINDHLKSLPGVLDIQFIQDGMPVKNIR